MKVIDDGFYLGSKSMEKALSSFILSEKMDSLKALQD